VHGTADLWPHYPSLALADAEKAPQPVSLVPYKRLTCKQGSVVHQGDYFFPSNAQGISLSISTSIKY
jgi:hypothetical protein